MTDTKITLIASGAGPATDGHIYIDATIVSDPNLTMDSLGLLAFLASRPGTHLLADIARERFYDPACLTAIADDLVHAGYAEITDGGDA